MYLINIKSLYFDRRMDKKMKVKCEHLGEVRFETWPKEHITVLAQPGDIYIDHVTPSSVKAVHIASEIEDTILENESYIIALGGDGTPINTGRVGAVFRRIENPYIGLYAFFMGSNCIWKIILLFIHEKL